MWDNLTVNGFHFETAAEYADAKKEHEAIEYICSKMDISNPEVAFKVYYKLLERKNLHTIVGYSFLKELRDRIAGSGIIKEEELRSINAPKVSVKPEAANNIGDETSLEIDTLAAKENSEDNDKDSSKDRERDRSKERKLKAVADYYRLKTKKCHIIIAALAVVIIAIFAIGYYRGGLNFNDAEIVVQNKYSAWAEELAEKEANLESRARELDKKEIELNEREVGMPVSTVGNLFNRR